MSRDYRRAFRSPFDLTTTTAVQNSVEFLTPSGVILMWSGLASTVPTGWVICNSANNLIDSNVPNLDGLVPIAATSDLDLPTATIDLTTEDTTLVTTPVTLKEGTGVDIDITTEIDDHNHNISIPCRALYFIMKL